MLGSYGLNSCDSGQESVSGSCERGKKLLGSMAKFTVVGALEKSKCGGFSQ
jgi:hypothetical protein